VAPEDTSDDAKAGPDLTGKTMGAIDLLVDTIHDKVIRPILLVGRTLAFSFIIIFAAAALAVALAVAILRILDVYVFPDHQWASWAVLGLIFVAGGLITWRSRRPVPAKNGGSHR
jgi:hypothetical protein